VAPFTMAHPRTRASRRPWWTRCAAICVRELVEQHDPSTPTTRLWWSPPAALVPARHDESPAVAGGHLPLDPRHRGGPGLVTPPLPPVRRSRRSRQPQQTAPPVYPRGPSDQDGDPRFMAHEPSSSRPPLHSPIPTSRGCARSALPRRVVPTRFADRTRPEPTEAMGVKRRVRSH